MADAALVQCTFYGNAAPHGGNISSDCSAVASITGCIVAASSAGVGLYKDSGSGAVIECTNIYGNAGGDWVGLIAGQYGLNGNICLDPMFCDPENGDFTLSEGSPCLPDYNPECGLIGAHERGCTLPSAVADGEHTVSIFKLANYPNPFNPATMISFDLPVSQQVGLHVFTIDGRLVTTLQEKYLPAGPHIVRWNGNDANGRPLASGTYITRLQAGEIVTTMRMSLIR
jgi:hypothetical protein